MYEMMVQSQCRTCFEPVLKERFVIFLSTCTFDLKESPLPVLLKLLHLFAMVFSIYPPLYIFCKVTQFSPNLGLTCSFCFSFSYFFLQSNSQTRLLLKVKRSPAISNDAALILELSSSFQETLVKI